MRRDYYLVIWLLPVVITLSIFSAANVCAEGVNFRAELQYTNSEIKSTNKTTGEKTRSDAYSFDQIYNFDLSKTIYPYLTFAAGTYFELDNSTTKTAGTKTKTEERLLIPFVQLNLNNPLYQAGIQYRRTQRNEQTPNVPNIERVRDEINTSFSWLPSELPNLSLRYNHFHTYDHPKTEDTINKLFYLESEYTAWEDLRFNYSYSRNESDQRLNDFNTLEQAHFGKVEYSNDFLDRRLMLNTAYRIDYSTMKFSGEGSREVALQRTEGLFRLDNTPQDGPALEPNGALIDGDLIASAGIDIGTGGDQTTLANIGVDFGFTTRVDEIRIWVARRLPTAIANSFSWGVYTSPDNTDDSTWTLVATVSPAVFGAFDNRFEISFPAVTTRFIKVVTTALSSALDPGNQFTNIFVTEMQAFVTVSQETQNKRTSTDQYYDLGLRGRLSEKTVVGYNLNVTSNETDPSNDKRRQLSNDLFMSHSFNKIFSTSARVSRIDTSENNYDTVSYTYGALLKGNYLPTFQQLLTFSGTSEKTEDDSNDNYSVVLRNNASLYPGWSAFVDSGFNWNRPAASDRLEKTLLLKVSTNFQPHQKLTLNLNYLLAKTLAPEKNTNADFNLEAFFIPFRTLSLNARLTVTQREETRTLQNYNVNWSPFPDGTVQFFFAYTETLLSEENQTERNFSSGLSWTIRSHIFLEMSYNIVRNDSNFQKEKINTFASNLRINF
jgi:hypothetical protein